MSVHEDLKDGAGVLFSLDTQTLKLLCPKIFERISMWKFGILYLGTSGVTGSDFLLLLFYAYQ